MREILLTVETERTRAFEDHRKPPHLFDETAGAVHRVPTLVRRLTEEAEGPWNRTAGHDGLRERMGPSRQVEKVLHQVEQVAGCPLAILLQGETGTGKELVAVAIHRLSARREGPFVALDCAAIPETLIESELFGYERGAFTGADRRKEGHFQVADGGTLFLDEVVNLPLSAWDLTAPAIQDFPHWV